MEMIKKKIFQAAFEMDVFKELHLKIHVDVDFDRLNKYAWEDGQGERYVLCRTKFFDAKDENPFEFEHYFWLDGKIGELKDLFKKHISGIMNGFKKGSFVEWVTRTNPDTAWIFYRRTFDAVIQGEEFWESSRFTAELMCELKDGRKVSLKHLSDGTERLFLEDKYLGRIDTIEADSPKVVYSDCETESLEPPLFLCNTEVETYFPEGKYKPLFGSKTLFIESGVHIYHTGSLQAIVEQLPMAVEMEEISNA